LSKSERFGTTADQHHGLIPCKKQGTQNDFNSVSSAHESGQDV
jgi:hypothetical protein